MSSTYGDIGNSHFLAGIACGAVGRLTCFSLVWHRTGGFDLDVRFQGPDERPGYEVYRPSGNRQASFAALRGKLDNCRELAAAFQDRGSPSTADKQACLLWDLYLDFGTDAFRELKGVFSAAVADSNRQRIHLFRSPLLGQSLYYYVSREWLVVATEVHTVLNHPAVGDELNDAWLAGFFNFRAPPNAATPFLSVTELLPGELFTVDGERHSLVRNPPDIGRHRIRFRRHQDYVERFDELVSQSVARQVEDRKDIGIMLSGGLDSVPAAWWMRKHQGPQGDLVACSWSLPGFPDGDETTQIKQCAEAIDIPLHLVDGDALWPLNRPDQVPLRPDTPEQSPYQPLKLAVYRMAADHGCRFIFNGQFGDRLYPEYHHVPADALYGGKLGKFSRELALLVKAVGIRGLYRHSAFRQIFKKPLGWRGRTRIPENALTPFANGLIDWGAIWPPEASDHPRPDHYRMLLGVDAARGPGSDEFFTEPYGLSPVDLYADWDLVDFVLSVPAHVFWNFDESKVLMRRAVHGRVPESVCNRPHGGFLDSFFYFGIDKRIDWIRGRLFAGETDWPRFAERGKVQAMLDTGQPGQMESMLLWQCVAYEMWLDRYFR